MGLFDGLKKTGTNSSAAAGPANDQQVVLLKKSTEDLGNTMVQLTKTNGVDLSTLKARIVVVMDRSGSMSDEYADGTVQNILTRLLPLALQFDDNGELEVFLFQNDCREAEPLTANNYSTYVNTYITRSKYPYGGTEYAPAIKMTDKRYNDRQSKEIPTLVFFITDGANDWSDRNPCNKAIIESSQHGIFYAFIGVGRDSFDYLRSLDDLSGREIDNTGFMKVSDLNTVSNADLFLNSLKDFVSWLKAKKYV